MINSSMNIAISGLRAAETRLSTSANNIANMQSTTSVVDGQRVNTPYQPQQVVQSSQSTGGVEANVRVREPASVAVYDPSNIAADADGITQYPNVDLEEEVINQQMATYDFKANLKVIERTDEMTEDLLNIVA